MPGPQHDFDMPLAETRWKIRTLNKDAEKPEALYVPYWDARDVARKLDEIFGWDGWKPPPPIRSDITPSTFVG